MAMSAKNEDDSLEGALAFARTLKGKSTAEAVGMLILAFDMDLVSAKAVLILAFES